MNTQQFQQDWSKHNTVLIGQKGLRFYPRQDEANPQKTQIGQNTLQQQQGQKYITFLGDSLKDALGMAKVKIVPEKCNIQYTQLLGLIESRVDTQQNKRQQMKQDKSSITKSQEEEINIAYDHHQSCQKRNENLFNSTFQIFNKAQVTLQNKINEIGNMENEIATFKRLGEQFDQGTQQINFNCFDAIQDLLNQINNKENGNLDKPYQQSSNQFQQLKSKNPLSQPDQKYLYRNASQNIKDGDQFEQFEDGGQRFDRWQHGGPEYFSDQSKTYRKTDIDFFFSKVKSDEIHQMYKASQLIQETVSQFKQNMETEVKQKLHAKRAKLDNLLSISINQVKDFFLKLPLDYFKKEGDKILKHFKLPAYEDLPKSNLQSLPMKVEAFSISLSLEDLKRLQQDQLINDNLLEVYALYLRYCHQYLKSKQQQLGNIPEGDIIIFSQLFFETQYDGLRIKPQEATAFINNVVPINDLFNSSLINRFGFVINVDLHSIKHWIFFGVFNTTKEIVCYDSAASNSSYFKSISEALKNFFSQVGGGNYTVKKIDNCPRQQNGTDCGMFVMKFIQNFAYGVEQKFTQDNVTALRKKLHTFFPLLSYQFDNNCLDFELLQFYEDTFSIKSESYRRSIGSGLNSM